jgi:hypothetical protein
MGETTPRKTCRQSPGTRLNPMPVCQDAGAILSGASIDPSDLDGPSAIGDSLAMLRACGYLAGLSLLATCPKGGERCHTSSRPAKK